MRFENNSQEEEDDRYHRHQSDDPADVMKRILSIFDPSCTLRIQVQDGVIRFSTLLSATSNAHTVLCMHLKDLPISVRAGGLCVLVRVTLLNRIYNKSEGGGKWRWSVEDDAIAGKHNLVIERVDAMGEAGVVYKMPIKRDERGSDPDLEIGIPDRIVNMQAPVVMKLLGLLANWGRRSKWITLKAAEDVAIQGNDDLLSFSLVIQHPNDDEHRDREGVEVTVDCKQLYRSLLLTRLASHPPQADVSLGISQEALTVKVNLVGRWTCASILAIKLSE